MNPRHALTRLIQNALTELNLSVPVNIHLEHPARAEFGDYSTNVAMTLSGQVKEIAGQPIKNPRELAAILSQKIAQLNESDSVLFVSKVEVAGPGFINFFLHNQALLDQLLELQADTNHAIEQTGKNKTALLEYMQPNTNKPLHVGHLRNAALGASLANLLEKKGWHVRRATINNDRGLHITKSMWGYLMFARPGAENSVTNSTGDLHSASIDETKLADWAHKDWHSSLEEWSSDQSSWLTPAHMADKRLNKADHFIGYWYILADRFVEETAVQETWSQMLQAWENDADPKHQAVRALWQKMNDWFYEGYAQTAERYTFTFDDDSIWYESALYEAGKKVILEGAQKGLFNTADNGAVIADLSRFKLPDKVLLRGDGTGIYMTFDIELTRQRIKQPTDKLIWVVGNDQSLYFQQLFAVCELLGYGDEEKYKHFAYGMVRLPEGKMSSRKGLVVFADDILDQAASRVTQVMSETKVGKALSDQESAQIIEDIGVGAVKWTMLCQDPLSDITFDLEQSVALKGFAGPYIQYTVSRCVSILSKSRPINEYIDILKDNKEAFDSLLNEDEKNILRYIYTYFEVIDVATTEYAPHHVCLYLYELSQRFNAFYAHHQVLNGDDPQSEALRVCLTDTVAKILKDGLNVLGIPVVEKM